MCRCVLNLPLKHSCTFQTFLPWKLISKVPIYEVKTLRGLADEKAYISNVKLNWLVIIKVVAKDYLWYYIAFIYVLVLKRDMIIWNIIKKIKNTHLKTPINNYNKYKLD